MAVLPIEGIITMITVTGFIYNDQNMGNKTFDYAMIDGDAAECVTYTDDSDDYMDFEHTGDAVKNKTTLNATHIDETIILQAIQVIKFDPLISYLNVTDQQLLEIIKEGSVNLEEAEITFPEVVANSVDAGRNDTDLPTVVLIMKEYGHCLIMVKDNESISKYSGEVLPRLKIENEIL